MNTLFLYDVFLTQFTFWAQHSCEKLCCIQCITVLRTELFPACSCKIGQFTDWSIGLSSRDLSRVTSGPPVLQYTLLQKLSTSTPIYTFTEAVYQYSNIYFYRSCLPVLKYTLLQKLSSSTPIYSSTDAVHQYSNILFYRSCLQVLLYTLLQKLSTFL